MSLWFNIKYLVFAMKIRLRFRAWVLGLGFMIRIRVLVCESALFNALRGGESVVGLGNGN